MNNSYKCFRCFYINYKRYNMKNHFKRKKKCIRNPECSYNEEEIEYLNQKQFENKHKHKFIDNKFERELIDEYRKNNIHVQIKNDIKYDIVDTHNIVGTDNIILNNSDENTPIHDEENTPIHDEENIHIHTENNVESNTETEFDTDKNDKPIINNNTTHNTTHNTTNNTYNTMNVQNNTIININISNNLIPFDEDWDLSSIQEKDKFYLIFSKVMYTKLLELILKNDINSNVIVDNNSSKGLVFYKTNNDKKYEPIEIDKLVTESINKLHKQLIDIYKSIMNDLDDDIKQNMINPTFLNEFLINLEKKYKEFQDKSTIKNKIHSLIIDIYKRNQNKALSIMSEKKECDNEIEGY